MLEHNSTLTQHNFQPFLVPAQHKVSRGQKLAPQDSTGKRFELKLSSHPLQGHPFISTQNVKLYIFLYLRILRLPEWQSNLASKVLPSSVENASSSPYFRLGSNKVLKLTFWGCEVFLQAVKYTQWYLHTWFLGCDESNTQMKHTPSTDNA